MVAIFSTSHFQPHSAAKRSEQVEYKPVDRSTNPIGMTDSRTHVKEVSLLCITNRSEGMRRRQARKEIRDDEAVDSGKMIMRSGSAGARGERITKEMQIEI